MENLLTCPRGHRWAPGKSGAAGHPSVCPVCGAAPQVLTEMEASTLPPRDTAVPDTLHEPPGEILDPGGFPRMFGRYRLEKQLGAGGMGSVYLARDTQLDRLVALKIPHFGPDDGPKVRDRFLHEARAAAALQHANICPLHDVGVIEGTHYLTMAFIDGRSLAAVLRSQSKPLPMLQVAVLVRKLALALDEAHRQGVVHRDLKPDNIMITKRGEPVVMDFGLARRNDSSSRLTQQGTIMGTPAYMAPEQARGNLDLIGPASDIYSLGVILYELLAGRVPFQGDTMSILTQLALDEPKSPTEFRPDAAPEVVAICLKALAKDPAQRHRSMADFAAALAGYIRSVRGNASPSKENAELPFADRSGGMATLPESEAGSPRRSFHWRRAFVGMTVLLGLGGFGTYWALTHQGTGAATGTVKIELNGPKDTVEIKVDGKTVALADEAIELPPGSHELEVTGKDIKPVRKTFTVSQGEETPLAVELEPSIKGRRFNEQLHWPAAALAEGRIRAPSFSAARQLLNADFTIRRLPPKEWAEAKGTKVETSFRDRAFHVRHRGPPGPGGVPRVEVPSRETFDQFAFEASGRLSSGRGGDRDSWGLMVASLAEVGSDARSVVRVHLTRDGNLHVLGHIPASRLIKHKMIKRDQSNRLLLIVREGYLEVYVNFVAVIDPIPVDSSLTPARLNLVVFGRGAEADFDRVTVWSAAGLKPLKDRIAAVR